VRISLIERDVPSYFQSLEHLLRYCARSPFAIERLSVTRDAGGRATAGCCDANPNPKPRSHDTSRIAWAKLMARVGEGFPLECPNCGGDIRLRGDGRQEPAHFEPEVRKRKKARMASPA
jgi:hypothetical protein